MALPIDTPVETILSTDATASRIPVSTIVPLSDDLKTLSDELKAYVDNAIRNANVQLLHELSTTPIDVTLPGYLTPDDEETGKNALERRLDNLEHRAFGEVKGWK